MGIRLIQNVDIQKPISADPLADVPRAMTGKTATPPRPDL